MALSNTQDKFPEIESPEKLGELLGNLRKSKPLSIEKAAASIYLPVPIIEAIESGQIPPNVPHTFFRGYLHNYASFLGLNASEVVMLFMEEHTKKLNEVPLLEGKSGAVSDEISEPKLDNSDASSENTEKTLADDTPYAAEAAAQTMIEQALQQRVTPLSHRNAIKQARMKKIQRITMALVAVVLIAAGAYLTL